MFERVALRVGVSACVFLAAGSVWAKAPAKRSAVAAAQSASDAQGEALVQQALLAEVKGDAAKRQMLVDEALRQSPNSALANWAAGRVRSGGKWLPMGEFEQASGKDPVLIKYRAVRDQPPQSTDNFELFLAEWCQRNRLEAEASAHWRRVLDHDPNNSEALQRLGLHNYDGALLTAAEVAARKQAAGRVVKAGIRWRAKLTHWRHELNGDDETARRRGAEEMQAIDDVEIIPVLEELQTKKSRDNYAGHVFDLEVVKLLSKMRGVPPAEALVRQAALALSPEVRQAAAVALGRRALTEYVPYALGNMLGPIQRKFTITIALNGDAIYSQRLTREGAEVNDSQATIDEFQPDFRLRWMSEPLQFQLANFGMSQAVAMQKAQAHAARDEERVARENERTAALNQNLGEMLRVNTGQNLGADAEAWWKWWRGYNEVSAPAYKPWRRTARYFYIPGRLLPSCFVAGTNVATLTGLAPIESIRPGDRVLAQDPATGELAYKAVLVTTTRPPTPIRELKLGGETIRTTRGHRFWLENEGWRMAKELTPGGWLHAIGGPIAIESAEDATDQAAYNLVVADFHTYCVGEQRLLVHDNTLPRAPLSATPGLREAAAAK